MHTKRQGADVNRGDMYGRTPLHYAARMGHTVMVEKLVQWGADVHKKQQVRAQHALAVWEVHRRIARVCVCVCVCLTGVSV
jgi:hypothetical protein